MTQKNEYDQAAAYEIRLKGRLDPSWSDWFDGFGLTIHGDETMLDGIVSDQAALHGILNKINELGLSIISVNKLTRKMEEI